MGTINNFLLSPFKSLREENKKHAPPRITSHFIDFEDGDTMWRQSDNWLRLTATAQCPCAFFLLIETPPRQHPSLAPLQAHPRNKNLWRKKPQKTNTVLVPIQRLNMQTAHLNPTRNYSVAVCRQCWSDIRQALILWMCHPTTVSLRKE